jgi:dihydroorotate dehydrogenase
VDIYTAGLRPLLFGVRADPEVLHQQVMRLLAQLSPPFAQLETSPSVAVPWPYRQVHEWMGRSLQVDHPALAQTLWNLPFKNPIGLAAGFDKDGIATGTWPALGFGFIEVGTVTSHAQAGNPKPRLFRLESDQAVLNRMGFNNAGSSALAERLQATWQGRAFPIPIGVNLGKSKITPLEEAVEDYLASFLRLRELGSYFVVNVSSPNTPGLRSLQATEQLAPILQTLQAHNPDRKPILVKIAPDLEWEEIAELVDLAQQCQLAGMIATNTTIRRDRLSMQMLPTTGRPITEESGGISGAPLRQRSTEVIRFIWQRTQGTLPVIGVGGIFTAEDAWEKLLAGAQLLQIYTGWVYEGPWGVRRILEGLLQRLEARGLSHLSEVVGLQE